MTKKSLDKIKTPRIRNNIVPHIQYYANFDIMFRYNNLFEDFKALISPANPILLYLYHGYE